MAKFFSTLFKGHMQSAINSFFYFTNRTHLESHSYTQNQKITDPTRIATIFNLLTPISLASRDLSGNTYQLWKGKASLVLTILDIDGIMTVVPGHRICNALQPQEKGQDLLLRLEKQPLKKWQISFKTASCTAYIWPYLIAAGKDAWIDPTLTLSGKSEIPISSKEIYQAGDHFHKHGRLMGYNSKKEYDRAAKEFAKSHQNNPEAKIIEGKLNKRNKNEPDQIQRAITYGGKTVVIDTTGQLRDFYPAGNNSSLVDQQIIRKGHPDAHKPNEKARNDLQQEKTAPTRRYEPRPSLLAGRRGPSQEQFHQLLQKTGLVKSYNSTHPDHPAPSRGGPAGEIGGVGCSVELIEGLFNTPTSLFETKHAFFIPQLNSNEIVFTDQELAQILQELTVGIYVHDTVPFFSLHFNQNADLYPVIHPAYEKTLVGQVFSMLDYFMKGYLNGGVFKEAFVQKWQHNPVKIEKSASILQELINFRVYSENNLPENDQNYASIKMILDSLEDDWLEKYAEQAENLTAKVFNKKTIPEDPIFKDYTKFTNSFRIIAKQNKIQKTENLFVLDFDFDVFYTITPDPDYKIALEKYKSLHGEFPKSYQKLITAYDCMKEKIHDHMVKMPFCRKYFKMLGVINFFSYYFTTLKKHYKKPLLSCIHLNSLGCPSLLPSLPILNTREETITFNMGKLFNLFIDKYKKKIVSYLLNQENTALENELKKEVAAEMLTQLIEGSSKLMQWNIKENDTNFKKSFQKLFDQSNFLEEIKVKYNQSYTAKNSNKLEVSNYLYNLSCSSEDIKIPFSGSLFILNSDQSSKEIEYTKKIVGGCGMTLTTQKVQLSPEGEMLINYVWPKIQAAQSNRWVNFTDTIPGSPQGAAFSLEFEELPVGALSDKEKLRAILTTENTITQSKMNHILQLLAEDKKLEFSQALKKESLENLCDRQGRNLLHYAVTYPDTFYTQELLKNPALMNQEDEKKHLPIHYAAMSGHVSQLALLVKADKKLVHACNNQKATPLMIAIQHNQLEAVKFLLANEAKGDEQLSDGYTVLHSAIHRGNQELVIYLLENSKKAKETLNQATNEGITPLMLACQMPIFFVKFLISQGANAKLKTKNDLTALDLAVKNNNLPLCQLLLPLCPLSAQTIETAIKKSSLEINQLLAQQDTYLKYCNALGDTPLIMALKYANLPVATHILSLTSDSELLNTKNKLNESALQFAIQGQFYTVLEDLLKRNINTTPYALFKELLKNDYQGDQPYLENYINQALFTPSEVQQLLLTAALAGNYVAISNLLIPRGANLDTFQGPSGERIEYYLAQSDGIFLFRKQFMKQSALLLNLVSQEGKTLAYVAAEHGSWRVLNFLMDQIDQQKLTLDKHYQERHLFYSVLERGDIEGVRLFVEKLNDPTLLQEPLDDLGTHAVHLAAKSGSKEILDYLYNQGANFAVKDKKQQDSLFYAIQSENSEIVASLLDKKYQLPILAESIFAAAALEKDKIFLLLLKSGANLNHPSLTQQKTPLMLAIQHKNLRAFLRILEQKNVLLTTPSPTQPSPLLLASQEGEATMLSMLLLRLPQATKEKFKGNNALHLACENGHPACITLLLESGFSIHELNDRKVSPELLANKRLSSMAALGIEPYKKEYGQWLNLILTAIQSKNIQKILDLVQKCPINTYFSTSILGESYSGTLLHFLIKYCKSFPNTNELITQICSREGFKSNLKDKDGLSYAHLMINNKIDPTNWKVLSLEEKDNLGRTPLHLAITSKSLILLKGLIEKLGKSKLDPLDHLGLTPLIYAIQLNKKKFAKYLIRNGANLHLKNNQGITPLIFASAKGNYLMVRLLVKYGASINEIQKGSTITPLFAALEANQEEISLFLLYQGANARHLFEQNRLISHLAAEKGKNSILRLLAAKGQALLNSDENGLQPIHYAAKAGQIKTLSFLESLGISIESQTFPKSTSSLGVQTPLNFAASQGTVEAVKWLLEHQANPEKPTESSMDILASSLMNHSKNSEKLLLLFKDYLISNNLKYVLPATVAAIARDYIEPLKVLYQMGVPIHTELYQGLTSLHYACKYGALQCTEFLLEQNVNLKCLSSSGQTPLELAAANSSIEQFRLMLDQVDCDIDKRYQGGETLLHIAVRAGNLAHVALIIDAEADLNIQDVQGQTPLFIAAQKNLEEIVNLLLLCGADSSIKTIFNSHLPEHIGSEKIKNIIQARQKIYQQIPENQTYLHLAAQTNNLLAVQLNARNFCIDVNQQNGLGRTALHEAALHGQLANIRELLSKGASIDIQDKQGITPLGLTCLTNHHLPAFKFLLQAGANPKIPNKNGQVLTQIFQGDLTKYPFLELLTNQLV